MQACQLKLTWIIAAMALIPASAFAGAIGPNFFRGMDGSTVSSPITFESFFVSGPVAPHFTDALFTFTINDDVSNQTSPTSTDSVQLFYGALTGSQQAASSVAMGNVQAFSTSCTVNVNTAVTQTYHVDCALSVAEGNPNTPGSFANDFENGNGVSLVLACFANCINVNDKFIFSQNPGPGNFTNESLQLLPDASVPEPASIANLLMGSVVLAALRARRILLKK